MQHRKNSLKKSAVKTVQVKVGSKSVNKSYVKRYKKYFAKSNVGRKVSVKKPSKGSGRHGKHPESFYLSLYAKIFNIVHKNTCVWELIPLLLAIITTENE